ncbi:hypothetical protein N7G274_008773 [Stereocaulon virgatum]|uniref:Rhodopsin domain-containing protein n=1 Tax=Stereocaulon virgatum TaxID=373712 RepID=A0ABR4A0X7_9LECA
MSQPTHSLRTQSLVTTSLLAVAIVFPILATAAVALRFYARRLKSQRLKADDWTAVLSLVMCWAISINTIVAGGIAGINSTTMNPIAAATLFYKCLWIEGIPLGIGLASIKISILFFYRRIFVTNSFKWSVNVMVAVLIGWGISTVLVQIFAGDPVQSVWNPLVPKLRYNYAAFGLAVAGMSIVFDVIVLCFPLPVIKNLHMPTRRKVTVTGIFWLGAFCCVAASVRFYTLYQSERGEAGGKNYDAATKGFIWSHIEPNCSVIAACLPTFGNLFTGKHITLSSFRGFFFIGSRSGSSNSNINGGSENSILGNSNKSQNSRKAWQILDKNVNNNSVEITAQRQRAKSEEEEDLEAGMEMEMEIERPMRIDVTREFGSE